MLKIFLSLIIFFSIQLFADKDTNNTQVNEELQKFGSSKYGTLIPIPISDENTTEKKETKEEKDRIEKELIFTKRVIIAIIGIAIFLIFVGVIYSYIKNKKLKEEIQKEKIKNRFIERKIIQTTHFLQTPLHGILISLEEVLYNSKDKKIKNEINSIVDEIINLSNQIKKNLDSFKSDSSLNNIIKNSLLSLKKEFKRNNINIEYDEKVDYKYNSRGNLETVIYILLENAVRALSDIDMDEKIVTIKVVEKEYSYIIYVKDNGDGIKSKDVNKVFEKGFTTKSKDEGGGIGLYLAKKTIINDLNGEIKPYNDNGATFKITLPKDSSSK